MTKWACVLGASEGIGAAFATELAAAGYSLVLVARRTDPLQALAKQLKTEVETIALDLAAADVDVRLAEIASSRAIDVLVYNAALSIVSPFVETPLKDKLRILDVNVRGPVIAADVFGRAMAARGSGTIVLMSSLSGFFASPWIATYGATKAFNLSLGEALAVELREKGVQVIACCAGATTTPGYVVATKNAKSKTLVTMTAEEVAKATMAAMRRKKHGAFVPGAFNKFARFMLSSLMPRQSAVRTMGSETRKLLP